MNNKMFLFLFFLFIFLLPVNAIIFNELMYDAVGSDENAEWIEMYNEKNESVSIEGWRLYDDEGTNHTISTIGMGDYILQPGEYAVLAENPVVFLSKYNFSGTLFDSTFSLGNTEQYLELKNKSLKMQTNISYSYLLGGNGNGFTIGKHNGIWKETLPTPGKANQVSDICDWKVSINSDLIFENKTDVEWKVKTERLLGDSGASVLIKRKVEDIYGNIVKSYSDLNHNISVSETLNYAPNLNPGTYILKAEIIPSCNDSNLGNNAIDVLIAVKGNQTTQTNSKKEESSIEISQLYDLGKDKQAKFGQSIRARLKIYRGKTTKQTISVWIEGSERVSKVFEFKISTKYTEQDVTIPMQIMPNCKNKFEDGNYKLIAEGLDEKDSFGLEIFGNADDVCVKETETKSSIKEEKQIAKEQLTTNTQKNDEEAQIQTTTQKTSFNSAKPYAISTIMFESSQRKAEKLIPFGLISVLSTMIVVFILSPKI